MRSLSLVVVVLVAACGGSGSHGQSVCDNVVPPPAQCMTQCDPAPGAPSTCPGGYHCTPDGLCDAFCSQGGNECGDGYRCTPDGNCVGNDECIGLECQIVDCAKQGMPATTISGTVFAPNGTLPLYGIDVYVPNTPLGPPVAGAICDRCGTTLPGFPLSPTRTDETGHFTLQNVPAGTNVPVVIQSGKWRRTITIPTVNKCTDNALAAADTHLPKNKAEGDIPKIAITTGSADALECLIRKLGVDASEITSGSGTGQVHLYSGNGVDKIQGGGNLADAQTLWGSVNTLKPYDIVILSCEGSQNPDTKSQTDLDAMKAYADLGGRVFASHWHNIWIEGSTQDQNMRQKPAVWAATGPGTGVATWNNASTTFNEDDTIDEVSNPKGMSFATWMLNVGGSTTRDAIPVTEGKQTATGIVANRAERWVYWKSGNDEFPQNFQFTTPLEAPADQRCGKVVFSDMHVASGSSSPNGGTFPNSCASSGLTPQEKALAFMFFDIASCVQPPIF